MREWFGSWGLGLQDAEFACAVVGLGLVPEQLRGGAAPRRMEQAVAERLEGDPRKLLRWSLDVLPTEKDRWGAVPSAARLADRVRTALARQRRMAMEAIGPLDGLVACRFVHRHLMTANRSSPEPWILFVSSPAPGSAIRLRWPCRIGYFPGTPSESTALHLQSLDDWDKDVFDVQPLTRRQSECDLLVWQAGDLPQAVEALSDQSWQIGGAVTDLLVVFAGTEIPETVRVRDLEPLRRIVDATGLLWVTPHLLQPGELMQRLLVGLAHDQPLDVAVANVTGNSGLLLADERLIAQAQLHKRLLAAAQVMKRSGGAAESIRLDPAAAGRLGIPPETRTRSVAGELIEKRLEQEAYGWSGESHEASAFGRVARSMRAADEQRRVPRFLQTGIQEDPPTRRPLQGPLAVDTTYTAEVFIGERNPTFLSLDTPFPHLDPPDDGRAHRLTVVFWEPHLVSEPLVRSIELPPFGSSSICRFPFHTRQNTKMLTARITVLHRNRVLQTGLLQAPVGKNDGSPSFRLDAAPRVILNGLDQRLNFNTAFILNDIDSRGAVHAVSGDRAAVFDMDDAAVRGLVGVLDAAITDITERPRDYEGLRAPGSEALLRTLAQKGASLREYLMRHALRGGNMSPPTHVQVVSAKPAKIFPVEFLYTLEAPENDAVLCAGAETALAEDQGRGCQVCQPAIRSDQGSVPIDQERVICPVAFWGLRCIIERKAHTPSDAEIGGDYKLIPEPVGNRDRVLYPLRGAVIGATGKANRHDPAAVPKMIDRVRQVVSNVEVVQSWQGWVDAIGRSKPSLLALVVHQDRDRFGTPVLDIGSGPVLKSDLVKAKHVRPDDRGASPISLLVGCETALADIDYESFALRFQWRGAALVVSTIAKILGRQAAPAAAELIEAMANVQTPKPFAEVMRDLRRRLLLKGTPMVLALTALGDADWDIVGRG